MAKIKAKRFRIATEGATTDGRVISRAWIEEMAASYDPTMFGARINLEHIKALTPDSPFRSYGDVTALTAEEISEGPLKGKLALYGDIDPTPELVALTKARQKTYTSVEFNTKFADTGKAYLVGLAVTDNPASLGTEYLAFSATAKENPLASRKQHADNLFTAAEETLIEFTEEAEPPPSLMERVTVMFSAKKKTDDGRFGDVTAAVTAVAEQVQKNGESQQQALSALEETLSERLSKLEKQVGDDSQALAELKGKLQGNDGDFSSRRPPATGGDVSKSVQTDC